MHSSAVPHAHVALPKLVSLHRLTTTQTIKNGFEPFGSNPFFIYSADDLVGTEVERSTETNLVLSTVDIIRRRDDLLRIARLELTDEF